MIKVYIAGPINTYIQDVDKEELKGRFGSLQRWLKTNYGHWQTVNPLEVGTGDCDGGCMIKQRTDFPSGGGHAWECWMAHDIAELVKCEAIVLLPGWELSNGAQVEELISRKMLMLRYYAELDEDPETGRMAWSIS